MTWQHHEMEQRVAAAIMQTAKCEDRFSIEEWIPVARAAIAAMRDPTIPMVQAAMDQGLVDRPSKALLIWYALIDRAITR